MENPIFNRDNVAKKFDKQFQVSLNFGKFTSIRLGAREIDLTRID